MAFSHQHQSDLMTGEQYESELAMIHLQLVPRGFGQLHKNVEIWDSVHRDLELAGNDPVQIQIDSGLALAGLLPVPMFYTVAPLVSVVRQIVRQAASSEPGQYQVSSFDPRCCLYRFSFRAEGRDCLGPPSSGDR